MQQLSRLTDSPDLAALVGVTAVIVVVLAVGLPIALRHRARVKKIKKSLLGSDQYVVLKGEKYWFGSSLAQIVAWYDSRQIEASFPVYDPVSGRWARARHFPEIQHAIAAECARNRARSREASTEFAELAGCVGSSIFSVIGFAIAAVIALGALFFLVKLVKWIWYF